MFLLILNFLSKCLIPFVIFYIVAFGISRKQPVFQQFLDGGKSGFQIVVEIAPTIIGLFVAIGILRDSGTLDLIVGLCKPMVSILRIPVELVPISIVKLFSSSSANGLLFDIFKEYGTDSEIGLAASILLSCTETLFYTVSVYFMSNGIRKSRWVIPVGIGIMLIGMVASVRIAQYIVG